MTDHCAEFIAIAEEAKELSGREVELDQAALGALEAAAQQVGRSWSKSSLGYQANVYYESFKAPPPGAMFSREWGFLGMFQGPSATGSRTSLPTSWRTSRSWPGTPNSGRRGRPPTLHAPPSSR